MAIILDGKMTSMKVRERIKAEVEALPAEARRPGLAVVIVGDDPASHVYVRNKKKGCEEVGFLSREYALPETTTEEELIALVEKLNADEEIDGILVQLPLPRHLDEKRVIEKIDSSKDVDAFSYHNVGRITVGDYDFLPCTPAGVMELIKLSEIDVCGKKCVVVGRSNIVGKPMSMLLLHKHGTVTICHSRTKNLAEEVRNADIVVAAVGVPELITGDMIKPGAVVIDVGMNRLEDGRLVGDVEYSTCSEKASAITPVPGGVGPMTIAMLMKNTVKAAQINKTGK